MAQLSLAGPDSLYITNAYYSGTQFSVILKYNGDAGALVYGPYFDAQKLILDSYQVGEAQMRLQGNDTLVVSDLVLGGEGYSARLKFDGVDTLNLASWWQVEPPKTQEAQIAELERANKRLAEEIVATKAKYDGDIASLNTQLAAAKAMPSTAATVAMPTASVTTGFARGTSLLGSWTASATAASQSDNKLFYAKYAIPVTQNANTTLYSFSATAATSGTGFVGYGLHFFVSGDKTGGGYGFGNSYLVWLTRDPSFYQTDATYVQVYRSFDDMKMIQLASASVADSIFKSNKVDILYSKTAGTISVMVNGKAVLTQSVVAPLASGTKVAFRTLGGPVDFANFSVKAQ
jgi:hypothetical protein